MRRLFQALTLSAASFMTGCNSFSPIGLEHEVTKYDLCQRLSPERFEKVYVNPENKEPEAYASRYWNSWDEEREKEEAVYSMQELFHDRIANHQLHKTYGPGSSSVSGPLKAVGRLIRQLIFSNSEPGAFVYDATDWINRTGKKVEDVTRIELGEWKTKLKLGQDSIGLFFRYSF